ncbi:MAG: Maf family nucleotide pyrophosphatase [Bacteroidales bacterium]|jgi:septum formation protein|nr:Maf family nucleotide pyrophosphatase [Bacteroidales bacterium]
MISSLLSEYNIVLASQSPRRKELLKLVGLTFNVKCGPEFDEVFPDDMSAEKVPLFLAECKSDNFGELSDRDILITSDTVVAIDGNVLGKPENREDAIRMIKSLSGRNHQVHTGVYLRAEGKQKGFLSTTNVFFRELTNSEIEYYVDEYKPYDKAGAYGIQEWIGAVGVEKIEGSYFNVMGLPVQQLYTELIKFVGA